MERPNNYPRAEGKALDALAANMGITRLVGESDAMMRRRVVDYIRAPLEMQPMGMRQRIARWMAHHFMPTFALWLHSNWYVRSSGPEFIGEIPPRWVEERNIDGSFTYP